MPGQASHVRKNLEATLDSSLSLIPVPSITRSWPSTSPLPGVIKAVVQAAVTSCCLLPCPPPQALPEPCLPGRQNYLQLPEQALLSVDSTFLQTLCEYMWPWIPTTGKSRTLHTLANTGCYCSVENLTISGQTGALPTAYQNWVSQTIWRIIKKEVPTHHRLMLLYNRISHELLEKELKNQNIHNIIIFVIIFNRHTIT